MMYSHKHGIGFIHIPKAAGTSIRQALTELWGTDCYEDRVSHNHMQGSLIRDYVLSPVAFSSLRWFAVSRHPVHTIYSSWTRTRQVAADPSRRGMSSEYCDYLTRVARYATVDEYAREEWLRPDRHLRRGGLWHTYCEDTDGTPLPIRALRFDQLESDWQSLCDDWSIPHVPLPTENVSGDKCSSDSVPQFLQQDILQYCWIDCERFGYA